MHSALRGDESMVQALLRYGAKPETTVALDHPVCPGWAALHFAVSANHYSIAQVFTLTPGPMHSTLRM